MLNNKRKCVIHEISLYRHNFHKRENVEQLLFRLPERYRKIFLPFHIFLFFFFQQNSKLYLSVTSQSFFSCCISDIILKEWILSHFIIQKQFTKQIPTSTVEERIAIPFVNMFIPLFDMIQVSTHIEDICRLTWISCPYAQMGCKEKVRTS